MTALKPSTKSKGQLRLRGLAYGAGAGLAGSLGGLSLRLVEHATLWQMAALRYGVAAAAVFLFCWFNHRRGVLKAYATIGWAGVAAAVLMACHHLAYVAAILGTTVANVAFVLSSTPVLAALLGIVVAKERVRPIAWVAIAGTIVGVGIMVSEGLEGEGALGLGMAFAAAATLAGYVVLVRSSRKIDMIPAFSVGALFAGIALDHPRRSDEPSPPRSRSAPATADRRSRRRHGRC